MVKDVLLEYEWPVFSGTAYTEGQETQTYRSPSYAITRVPIFRPEGLLILQTITKNNRIAFSQ